MTSNSLGSSPSGATPPKPTTISYAFSKIPAYLRERPQWVCWRYALTQNSKGDQRWTKVPYRATLIGSKADSTDPSTWATFEQAVAAHENPAAQYDGIGYCLGDGENIVGIDIDHAVSRDADGKLVMDAVAQDIVSTMQSYTELSVSGTGVHVFAFGTKLGDRSRRGSVEMYSRARFLTFTGQKFKSAPATIEERPDQIEAVYETYLAEPEAAPQPDDPAGPHADHTDAEVLEKARGPWKTQDHFRALYDEGDLATYGSQSEADLALCGMLAFWAGPSPEQIDRLFRASKLMRPKWDTKRGRSTYGAATVEKALAGRTEFYAWSESAASGTVEEVWPAPLPIPDDMPAAPELTREMLPRPMRDWIFDIANRMKCPPDYPAVAALIALGTLVGKKVQILPKCRDNWTVVPNLWGFVVGAPGVLKSSATKQGLGPLYRIAQEERDKAATAGGRIEAQAEEIERLKAKIKGEKKGDHLTMLKEELAVMERNMADAKPPVVRRLITNDATIEKLGMLLNENPNGLLIEREELTGLFHAMEQEGHQQDRSFYLEAWDGLGSKAIDRVGRGSLWVPSCIVSIQGTIQPGPLAQYLLSYHTEGQADGFIERFQMSVYPTPRPWDYVDEAPNRAAIDRAMTVYTRLHMLPDLEPLHFSADAQALFIEWWGWLQRTMAQNPKVHPLLQSHFSKYRSLMPSLALLFQLANSSSISEVGLPATQMAAAWCDYLAGHARRIYWPVVRPGGSAMALLARRLRDVAGERLTARDFERKHWSGLDTSAVIEEGLEALAQLHWVRPEKAGRWGRGTRWAVNPSLSSLSLSPLAREEDHGWSTFLPSSSSSQSHSPRDSDSDDSDAAAEPEEPPF